MEEGAHRRAIHSYKVGDFVEGDLPMIVAKKEYLNVFQSLAFLRFLLSAYYLVVFAFYDADQHLKQESHLHCN